MTNRTRTHAHIAVPVRDEEQGLPLLLQALARQRTDAGSTFSVHLLFDGCSDRGVEIARRFIASSALTGFCKVKARAAQPNAGHARRAAVDFALSAPIGAANRILLTTDADTVPDDDWVSECTKALREVDVVAGHTRRDGLTRLRARDDLETYLERLHALRRRIDPISYDPAPSHPWVGGANLGMRLTACRQLGGFRPIASGEDKDLVDRARHIGLRVRQSRAARVTTSSRTSGRARGGLADALGHMQRETSEPRVEHPLDAARQYARHALARQTFAMPAARVDWRAVGRILDTDRDVRSIAVDAPNAEAFVMKAVPSHPSRRDLPLSEASRLLETLTPEQFRAFDFA